MNDEELQIIEEHHDDYHSGAFRMCQESPCLPLRRARDAQRVRSLRQPEPGEVD